MQQATQPLEFYPPSVQGIPPTLTNVSDKYRRYVVIVLISLVVFMGFYLGLIAFCCWLTYSAVQDLLSEEAKGVTHLGIVSIVVPFLLVLFLIKSLFKRYKFDSSLMLQVTESQHPKLFAFIQQLCNETKAPLPLKVFITPDVNAAVSYDRSLLNLFFPTKKNLIIGAGLINTLPLNEFKAVLAHEFGHFSQSSMKLGTYVYIANRIIADMVFARDAFDALLHTLCRTDIRIAWIAWILYAVVWVLRKILELAFRIINILEATLSRQMEFHADLVAVSLCGSDSIVHALRRLDFSSECLSQAYADLKTAADHKLYSRDLFYHQTKAADYLRAIQEKPDLGTIPPVPPTGGKEVQLFTPEDSEPPSMWESHPPNHEREQNAKNQYFRSIEDDRSPWILFEQPEQVRFQLTKQFYEYYADLHPDTPYAIPEQVQKVIDEEHAETNQNPRYKGFFDGRFIHIDEVDPLVQERLLTPDKLLAAAKRLYQAEFADWFEKYQQRRTEQYVLEQIQDGTVQFKGKTFKFREEDKTLKEVPQLIEMVDAEIESDIAWLKWFDSEMLKSHFQMALATGSDGQELVERYRFHLALQNQLKEVGRLTDWTESILNNIQQQKSDVSEKDMIEIANAFNEIQATLYRVMFIASKLPIPPLQNMRAGAPLSEFLLEEPVLAPLVSHNRIPGEWIGKLMQQLNHVQDRAKRLHFKSLGTILAQQENIATKWQEVMGHQIIT